MPLPGRRNGGAAISGPAQQQQRKIVGRAAGLGEFLDGMADAVGPRLQRRMAGKGGEGCGKTVRPEHAGGGWRCGAFGDAVGVQDDGVARAKLEGEFHRGRDVEIEAEQGGGLGIGALDPAMRSCCRRSAWSWAFSNRSAT